MSRPKYWEYSIFNYDFADKEKAIRSHVDYMLCRTQSMFKYDGLPETIPAKFLELFLQTHGTCCITKVNGELYALTGSIGGEPDEYYQGTVYTVSNPALKFSKNLEIDEECVVIWNDSLKVGLIPLFSRYAKALVENELSMNIADINTRIISLISAGDERTRDAAIQFINDIQNGKSACILENQFLEGIKSQPYAATSQSVGVITTLIEYEQYLKASWYNDLGLNSNYNMKRESINSNESQLNEDALYPFIEDMLRQRQEALEKVNAMFGTSITVSFNSSWEDNVEELEAELDILESEVEDEPEESASEISEEESGSDESVEESADESSDNIEESEDEQSEESAADDEEQISVQTSIEDMAEDIEELITDIIEEVISKYEEEKYTE